MLVKTILLFAFLTVVRASVIVNIFDDGEIESNHLSSLRSCDLRWCEQTCRKMGFRGGVCVGDRCKCDILKSHELVSKPTLDGCDISWCRSKCQSLGYSNGICIDNKCYCYMNEGNVAEEPVSLEKNCLSIECDQGCRRMGYARGVCLGNECRCSSLLTEEPSNNEVSYVTM